MRFGELWSLSLSIVVGPTVFPVLMSIVFVVVQLVLSASKNAGFCDVIIKANLHGIFIKQLEAEWLTSDVHQQPTQKQMAKFLVETVLGILLKVARNAKNGRQSLRDCDVYRVLEPYRANQTLKVSLHDVRYVSTL